MANTDLSILLEKGLRSTYLEALNDTSTPLLSNISSVISSNSADEKFPWLGESGAMSSFPKGSSRQISQLTEAALTATPQRYASTISISRLDYEDDTVSGVSLRVAQMAQQAGRFKDALCAGVINSNAACYDGQPLFSETHPARGEQSAAQSNIVAGSGTTAAAMSEGIHKAVEKLRLIKDESGNAYHGELAGSLCCVVPPALESAAMEVLQSSQLDSSSNVQQARAQLIVSSQLSGDPSDWYMFVKGSVQPIIYVERDPVSFEAVTDGTENTFMKEEFLFGTRMRAAAIPSHWAKSIMIKNS